MSNYGPFECGIDNDDGTTTALASETLDIYDTVGLASLGTVASDSDGHVAAGTVAVAAGTLIRFSFRRANGICGYCEVLTT